MKIGDYVRTEDGRIGKIISKGEIKGLYFKTEPYVILDIDENKKEECIRTLLNEIVKSSPNIIDLIEVGDFVNYEQVNGGYVLNKKEDSIDTWAILPNSLKNEDIKSVITREQMKSLEYKVKE